MPLHREDLGSLTQRAAAAAAVGLAVAPVVLFLLAAATSGTQCTFDNVGCRRNQLLGVAVRCAAAGAVAGAVWAVLRARRRRRHDPEASR